MEKLELDFYYGKEGKIHSLRDAELFAVNKIQQAITKSGKINEPLNGLSALPCGLAHFLQGDAAGNPLVFHGIIFHTVGLCLFADGDVLPLDIGIHHDDGRLIVIAVFDHDRHGRKACQCSRMVSAVSGDQLISSLFPFVCYGGTKTTE